MTLVLVRKLFRDLRLSLILVALLLLLFQILWGRVAFRISGQILDQFRNQFISIEFIRKTIFGGPGKIIETLMGGEGINIERARDLMSISYVHPLTQAILCIWGVGRSAGAIAGELDRGTMELLLAQPIRRGQVILAHLIIDLVTIPILCGVLWCGTWLGTFIAGLQDQAEPNLAVDPVRFLPGLLPLAALTFSVTGLTLWLSSAGRFRSRVLGMGTLLILIQFLFNVIGQLWDPLAWSRPLTIFYYFQPQPIILESDWFQRLDVLLRLGMLLAVGTGGYLLAAWTFCRRDLPAPL